jgi:hypothetical protein
MKLVFRLQRLIMQALGGLKSDVSLGDRDRYTFLEGQKDGKTSELFELMQLDRDIQRGQSLFICLVLLFTFHLVSYLSLFFDMLFLSC